MKAFARAVFAATALATLIRAPTAMAAPSGSSAPPRYSDASEKEKSVPYRKRRVTLPLFSMELPKEPERKRGVVLGPLLSFLLPGIDQWYENQYRSAAFYTGMAVVGIQVTVLGLKNLEERNFSADTTDPTGRDNDARMVMLGSQMYMAAGSYSAYESFRSAVRTRQPYGEYAFLTKEETTGDLLLAPFDYKLLARPTTFVPLGLALVGVSIALNQEGGLGNASFTASDAGFSAGFSYLAGTNEEALTRGWIMPAMMESWDSKFWSNTATATVFAAAHISPRNPVPWPQFVAGWYLGYLTQRNEWTLRESIFVHTWWDVIIFTGGYLYESQQDRKNARLYLPLVQATY